MHRMSVLILSLTLALLFSLPANAAVEPLNINTADAPAIAKAMKGVGLRLAQEIVTYRTQNGPFKSLEELTRVKGVGTKILEKNRDTVTIGIAKK